MDIQELRTQIEAFLADYPDVEKFKIGKTANWEDRENDYQEQGYNKVLRLSTDKAEKISETETTLNSYFRFESKYRNKCDNERNGGGSPDATILYIALKMKDINVQHLNEFEIIDKYFANGNNKE